MLVATQHNSEEPTLQIANLHGDIIATAKKSETTTTLASTIAEASEYGVPATETPPKYSWLGAHEIPTSLPSGVTTMGARSYIPQLGRFLQTDPQPGGSANQYAYTYGDPLNNDDLTGEYTTKVSSWAMADAQRIANEGAAAARIAQEEAERAEAEQKAHEANMWATIYAAAEHPNIEAPEEWGEEEWWEEEGEEYAAYHKGTRHGEAHTEEAQLVQPLGEGSGDSQGSSEVTKLVALCKSELNSVTGASQHGACARYVSLCYKGAFGSCGRFVKQSAHSNFSRCEVDFAGYCSSAAQVYARYKAQVAYQQNVVGNLREDGSRISEAIKYAKPPPP